MNFSPTVKRAGIPFTRFPHPGTPRAPHFPRIRSIAMTHRRHPGRNPLLRLTIAAATLAIAPASLAQDAPPAPEGIRLAEQPIRFDALGLTIRLPEDVLVETTSLGAARQSIALQDTTGAWRILIADQVSRNTRTTPRDIVTQIIENLVAQSPRRRIDPDTGRPIGGDIEVLERDDTLVINGHGASRAYIALRGVDDSVLIEGYTLFQTEPGRFVLLKLETGSSRYESARIAYETIVGTAHFPDSMVVASDRATAILAGENLLRSLTREDYIAALPEDAEWRRLYRPSPDGNIKNDQEIAYQRIEMREGKRGELNRRRSRDTWGAADHDEGFIVRIAARYREGPRSIDSETVYFMTAPGAAEPEESWTVRMAVREGNEEAVWMETGVRRSNRLTVRVLSPGGQPTEKTWMVPDEAYITQVETYMLPRLLAHAGAPLLFGFYAYNSASGEINLRRDVLEPAPDEGNDDDAHWVLRTRLTEGAPERITRMHANGDMIRAELPEGTIMEPIDVERLRDLWRSKGLPTN